MTEEMSHARDRTPHRQAHLGPRGPTVTPMRNRFNPMSPGDVNDPDDEFDPDLVEDADAMAIEVEAR